MSKIEERILDYLKKNSIAIFAAAVTLLAALVRFQVRGFLSEDMKWYLLPWYEEIKAKGGFAALGTQVGTYNITYQVFIALITYIDFNPVFLYKGFSILFDFLLAAVTGLLVYELRGRKSWLVPVLVYSSVLFLPTVLLNSSLWGQCDSVYTFFVMLSLYLLLRDRCKSAFVFLGIAVAFKLQAIFILPFLLIYYVTEKRYSILNLLLSVVSFYVMCLPGVLGGRSVLAPFALYFHQKGAWAALYSNFPSALVLLGNSWEAYEAVSSPIFVVIIALLGMELLFLCHRKIGLYRTKYFCLTAAWSLWTCMLFLPEMHERYAYLLDILLIAAVFLNRRYLAAAVPAFLSGVVTYANYLFHVDYDLERLAVWYILAYCIYSYLLIREINAENGCLETENDEKTGCKTSEQTK